jgi:hypothetical protein
MAKARTPRTPKTKVDNKVIQMPESVNTNSNGNTNHLSPSDLEAEIRLRAYELYAQRGYANGQQERDWLEAEREVLARHTNREHTA